MSNSSFFGLEGLTMTSANHIANLAKEFTKVNERALNSVSFIETQLTIIGSDAVSYSSNMIALTITGRTPRFDYKVLGTLLNESNIIILTHRLQ